MRTTFIILVSLALFITSALSAERSARRVENPDYIGEKSDRITGIDEGDTTLYYGDPMITSFFWTIPDIDELGDSHFNVRYTPPFAPFTIVEAHIPIFYLFGEQGTPGMSVHVWQSGEQNREEGYPGELIDSINIAFDDILFSDEIAGQDDSVTIVPVWNVIDFTDLEISFNDEVDFHVGVNAILDDERDSLAIISDDGQEHPTNRSIFWNGEDEEWSRMIDMNFGDLGEDIGFNFTFRVVIADPLGVRTTLTPSGYIPTAVVLNPAYPNPFNSQTRFSFSVQKGEPYSISLLDVTGRLMSTIESGVGNGSDEMNFSAGNFPAGSYFLQLNGGGETAVQRIMYTK